MDPGLGIGHAGHVELGQRDLLSADRIDQVSGSHAKLAVIGAFIAEGGANKAFEPVWANLPEEKGVEVHLEHVEVDVDTLLPQDRTTYRYDGSLTTPPCSEGVKWFVLANPVALSAQQIAAFRAVVQDNNRPTQPLNGRKIVTDHVTVK